VKLFATAALVLLSLLVAAPAQAVDNSNRCADLEAMAVDSREQIAQLNEIVADYQEIINYLNERISEKNQVKQHFAEQLRVQRQALVSLGYRVKIEGSKVKFEATTKPAKTGPRVKEAMAVVRASHKAIAEINRMISADLRDRAAVIRQRNPIKGAIATIEQEIEDIELLKADLGCPVVIPS
jgi:hypothetical protein